MNFAYAIFTTFFVSAVSLVGIFSLLINEKILDKLIFMLISFASGSLIGASFLHIIPEIVEDKESIHVFYYVVFGFILFFILEKYFHWRHCHRGKNCEFHPVSYLNLIGDGLHNFIDGILIGSSFYVDTRTGFISVLAVLLHEIPQEIGDFGVLIHSGFSRLKALMINFLVSFFALAGTICGYLLSDQIKELPDYILPVVAGGFIYISSCDLIPELHREKNFYRSIISLLLFVLGVFFMGLIKV
ncbi:MAG: ZIP family metal transporter [Endomicrobiia bacterium]